LNDFAFVHNRDLKFEIRDLKLSEAR